METQALIDKLIRSRKLLSDTNEDWEIYDVIEQEIYQQKKVRDLEVYFYGFDDETFGDPEIMNYLECVFYGTRIGEEGNKYTEAEIIEKLIQNFEIFNPHACDWYGLIIQELLAHFSDKTYDSICEQIAKLSSERKKELGELLENAESFSDYDDMHRITDQYNGLIAQCEN